MSWYRMNAIERLRNVTASEKAVLWVLASHENDKDGRCFPSLNRIARESGLARRTVVDTLERLREKKLIFWKPGSIDGLANEYSFGPLMEKVIDKDDPKYGRYNEGREGEPNPYYDGRPYRADLIGFMP